VETEDTSRAAATMTTTATLCGFTEKLPSMPLLPEPPDVQHLDEMRSFQSIEEPSPGLPAPFREEYFRHTVSIHIDGRDVKV